MNSDNNQEMFPLVNEQGNIIGAATRGECHNGSKLLHPVIHLHVFNSKGELYRLIFRHFVFIGAMWLIFAPSSDKEQQPGTGGYNIEMPDADKANRQIIGDKAKAYEQGAMEERQENRSRAMQELGDMFDREVRNVPCYH